ncbi:hypothetical protein [Methylobacterium oryzae]|uniref:hypothetical protein n=1 Tax=Methylobacterium oryzae TaxID=334852 RepID=UPI001F317CA0|nr:hypothetical protein [Methylobacterium oryzae]UIN38384.1 hypothetical protein LXM90_30850 [Methylobacterium oryzae]
MDLLIPALVGTASAVTLLGSAVVANRMLARARKRAVQMEEGAEGLIQYRVRQTLDYIDGVRARWRQLDVQGGLDLAAALRERIQLEEMVQELREENADLRTELEAHKVDSIEQGRAADAYARQAGEADAVIDHLTWAINESGNSIHLPGHLAEAHAESLIRTGLKGRIGRTTRTIGRAA